MTQADQDSRRIRNVVCWAVDDAFENAMVKLNHDVREGRVTADEVADYLRPWPDLSDAWDEYGRAGLKP